MTTPNNTHDLYEAGIDAALHALNRVTPAPGLEQRVISRLAQEAAQPTAQANHRSNRFPRRSVWRITVSTAAAVLLMATAGLWQLHRSHPAADDNVAAAAPEAVPVATAPAATPVDRKTASRLATDTPRKAVEAVPLPSLLTQQEQMLLTLVQSVPASELPLQKSGTQQSAGTTIDDSTTSVAVADPGVADPDAVTASRNAAYSAQAQYVNQ